jgi:hypothetical protein
MKGCKRFVAVCKPKSKKSGWGQIQFSFAAKGPKTAASKVALCLQHVGRSKARYNVDVMEVRNAII